MTLLGATSDAGRHSTAVGTHNREAMTRGLVPDNLGEPAAQGNVSGTRRDDALTLTVTPPQPPACPVHVTATIDGETIQGTYATVDCPMVETGTVTLTRH